MKQGKTLKEIMSILKAQRAGRKDLLVKTDCVRLTVVDGKELLNITTAKESFNFAISANAHKQLAEWIKLPSKYYDSVRREKPQLLENLLNAWFARSDQYKLFRMQDNTLTAFFNDCYLRYDNMDLLDVVSILLEGQRTLQLVSADLTPERMYLKIIDRNYKEVLKNGDCIYAGLVISNSEIGVDTLKFEPMFYKAKTKSCYIFRDYAKRIYHTDKQVSKNCVDQELIDYDSIAMNFEPLQESIVDIIADTIKAQPAVKTMALIKVDDAANMDLHSDYLRSVDSISTTYRLSTQEKAQLYLNMANSQDKSYLAIISALSDRNAAMDYTRATELERIAGTILLGFRQDISKESECHAC